MTIQERASGAVTILDIAGNMTIEVEKKPVVAERVRQLLPQGRHRILLNLERVPYVDTSGLCDIVEAYVATTRQGGSLKLLRVTPRVRDLLVITKLLTVLDAYDSETAAIASFGAGVG